jgi:hypothetical protein
MLVSQGYQAFHWLEIGPKGASDAAIFLAAQQRSLTLFTYNRDDYLLLIAAWQIGGHGDQHSLITLLKGTPQLPPATTLAIMQRYCADPSSFINRVVFF